MMTFTVSDLNRQLAKVLETCDRLGAVRIRSRSGRIYVLRAEPQKTELAVLPDLRARSKRMAELAGGKPILTKRGWEYLAKAIRGD